MLDGPLVVLGVRDPVFNTAVGCDTVDSARAVCKYNPDAHARVLDLETGQILWEEERGWIPRTAR